MAGKMYEHYKCAIVRAHTHAHNLWNNFNVILLFSNVKENHRFVC